MLQFVGVEKRFSGVPALRDIHLTVGSGETTALLGASGSGKSTLLRLALGLLVPDAGEVWVGDVRVEARSAPTLRRRMGYVIQDGGLFPHLDARGNVALMARHLGWERERIEGRVEELARLARLPADSLARHPSQLSGGQRQRVALMRALALDPELLLLDEPLGALDPLVRAELQEDLREVFRGLGKTVVLVTHDVAEAAFFAHRIVLLRDGTVLQSGSFEDLWRRPADPYVTRFIRAQRPPLGAEP
jgi:osmoprotectant transport system ATP-binding protein